MNVIADDTVVRAERRAAMKTRRLELQDYARSCLDHEDWRGLRDVAVDLEVIDARLDEQTKTGHAGAAP